MTANRSFLALLLFASLAFAGEPKRDRHGDLLPEGAVARLGTIQAHPGAYSIAFSPDGKSLMTVGPGSVRHWDTARGKITRTISAPYKDETHAPTDAQAIQKAAMFLRGEADRSRDEPISANGKV